MAAYYNEINPHAAAWLRELIARNLIAPGGVDERSIADVRPDDLRGFDQCHFFAGIGVWSYALRRAGWDDSRPVWTGSCPCQPFSAAGKGEGYADDRHLWPHWHRLIRECRPATIFGEQVAAAVRTGWLDDVCLSLESLGYAVGAFDFPVCSVGAPHIRQRIYFVAESGSPERGSWRTRRDGTSSGRPYAEFAGPSTTRAVADSERGTAERHGLALAGTTRGSEGEADQWQRLRADAQHGGEPRAVADDDETGLSRKRLAGLPKNGDAQSGHADGCGAIGSVMADADESRSQGRRVQSGNGADQCALGSPGATNGFWRDAEWIACRDGKARPTQSRPAAMDDGLADRLGFSSNGLHPLVQGAKRRVMRLRCYGNAIVAPQAQAFIESYLQARMT